MKTLDPFSDLEETASDQLETIVFHELLRMVHAKQIQWHQQALDTFKSPIRKYEHQSLGNWLGRLLSRKGVEDIIDNYKPDYNEVPWEDDEYELKDIMASPHVQKFKDVDNKTLFFDAPPGEARYLFTFSADGFNPFHLKQAKQSATSTAMWMILLNFPPHLRYLPENMYLVGVVP
ncbi:hypothetical protein K435DRAFT_659043, partial [Dendrothele bispora CBS 962.96]